jgi:glyoxylase-like metal-dependent hydrolase (beta-lactamase superfamily II)
MSAKSYSFKVGDFDCAVLLDSADILGRDRFLQRFSEATEADYRQAYADIGLSLDEADNSMNILMAKMSGETVLVDAGQGGRLAGGYLPVSMELTGVHPDTISLVVITHTHGDHVLGLVSDDNEPVFPKATYVLSKPEMAVWQERIDDAAPDQRPILTMMKEKGLRLIDMDEQILPGMTAVPIPGHTPGQIALLLESGNEKLLHMADLLHSPMQFAHPEWSARFDADTRVSVPTRRRALGRAADENMLTLFYHLTFPGLGWVKRAEQGFIWETLASG